MNDRLSHLTAFLLALSVILCAGTVYYAVREQQYAHYTAANNQKSLSQLLNSLSNMETALEKTRYAPTGAMRQTLAAEVWKESQLASLALSTLPLSGAPLESLDTYVSQAGDYAYYLMRSSAYGRANEQEWQALSALCDNASALTQKLTALKEQADAGTVSFRQITAADAGGSDGVSSALTTINEEFPEYASLIYDGPYSDHVSSRTAQALAGQAEVTQQQAAQKAADFLQADASALSYSWSCAGQIPCYAFTTDETAISVSRQGGMALTMTDNRAVGVATITPQEAVKRAAEYLASHGYPGMKESYYTVYETVVTVNFAYGENDILAYPDLIKVGVALDDGGVVRFDAVGYAMNHHSRTPAAPAVSQESARQTVPQNLTVQSEHLSLIPTSGYNEVLCWEFVCQTESGGHAILYVNCQTGQQENILLLIESENGVLTR